MPHVKEGQVLKAIRAEKRTEKTRILVVSGYPEDMGKLRKLGADGALAKPFDAGGLVAAIEGVLPASRMQKALSG